MPSDFYDVIIVGAGPAGSHAAYELALSGHNVAVLEQKDAAGLDVCCTGIISTECFDSFDISSQVILTRANSAKFFSPSGRCLKLQTEKVQAYVVDRALLDQEIASKAQSWGAHYFFSCQVMDIIPENDSMRVETLCHGAREIFTARAVILADGSKPRLPQKMGLGKIEHFVIGAQAEVEATDVDEVEIYLGRRTAPGFFAWLVPALPNKALVGLVTTSHAEMHLQKFLLSSFCRDRIINRNVEVRQKVIPMGTSPRTYGDRILVVGDAAGQVKPTTGGGIYFGHLGVKMAVQVLSEALRQDDLSAARLSRYQKEWKAKMGKEISFGYHGRQFYARLRDRHIERIFAMLDSEGMAQALLHSPNFSFDRHRSLILAGLKSSSAYPLRKLWRSLRWRPLSDKGRRGEGSTFTSGLKHE